MLPVTRDGHALLTKEKRGAVVKYGMLGGKACPGETDFQCMSREAKEESGGALSLVTLARIAEGRGLLGNLEALHTGLGHDVHRAGGRARAGGGADGGGLDGGDEGNLGDSHFDVGACLVTCVRMARAARRGVPKPDPRGRAEARPGG